MKCYSWSRYWSNGEVYHVFERENHKGYTYNLNEAGIYDIENPDIIDYGDISKAKKDTGNRCYYIPCDKINLLGDTHTTIKN